MSVQVDLTIDQTIRLEALDRSLRLHSASHSVDSSREVLLTAEAFAEFVKNATVPADVSA